MKVEAFLHNLHKILSTCEKHSILHPEIINGVVVGVRYGPLGYLLKRNIYREWLSSCLNNSDVPIFPVEIQKIATTQQNLNDRASKFKLLQDISEQCHYVTLSNHGLPYVLAVCCEHVTLDDSNLKTSEKLSELKGFNWKPSKWTNLCIAFFCSSKKSTHWFHYWQKQRYVWWRKFATIPSEFVMSDLTQDSSGDQQVSLNFQFPWATNKIEDIMQIKQDVFCSMHDESSSLSAVFSSADLDLAVLAYLCNSFAKKHRQGKIQTVLHLHHKLAPYKVAVTINRTCINNIKKLDEVSSYLIKELKRCGITVFPNLQSDQGTPESDFIRFDEMGLPYCVELSETSLVNGIAYLRNRDTTLQEQVHLTELTKKLLMYLQMSVIS